jgi:hypothetical protein
MTKAEELIKCWKTGSPTLDCRCGYCGECLMRRRDIRKLADGLQAAIEHEKRSCICAGKGICDPCRTLAEIERIAAA